jgi:hypothetical protein
MDYSNLQVLAEVSVALLGFSGLTIVMGHSRFDQHGLAYRTQGMLYNSSLAFTGSLLPLVGIPISFGAIAMAVLMSMGSIWAGMRIFGKSEPPVKTSPLLNWIFFPMYLMATLALWLSLFILSERVLFIYKLAIGCNLLVAVVFFIRLVISFFDTEEVSSDT